ncbi:uncharacterized protein LOC142373295 [Odontesthes bonariensis]|uniref:uncharacterized protein LOC142373295 n=1 Tax=Odontesthes bonariensis TaxID=219752 RepID=UPI003F58FA05
MFAAETKALVKNVGAQRNLIPNDDLNKKLDLLTLVKVREGRFWQLPKYKTMMCTLPELMEEDFSPGSAPLSDFQEEDLVKDFVTSVETSGSVVGGQQLVGEAQISASSDTVDGLALPVSIKKKTAVITNLRNRAFKQAKVAELGLKENDKLTFVHQTVYNTRPVKVTRKAKRDGSISASCQKTMSLRVKASEPAEILPCGHGSETQRRRAWIQAAEISFLQRGRGLEIEGVAPPSRGRSSTIQEEELHNPGGGAPQSSGRSSTIQGEGLHNPVGGAPQSRGRASTIQGEELHNPGGGPPQSRGRRSTI